MAFPNNETAAVWYARSASQLSGIIARLPTRAIVQACRTIEQVNPSRAGGRTQVLSALQARETELGV